MFRSLRRIVSATRPSHPQSPNRRISLRLEFLEERCVLSTLDACMGDAAAMYVVETAEADTSETVGPLETDAYFAAIGQFESNTALPAAEGEEATPITPPTSAPPLIVDFSARRVDNYWVISGRVTDDYSMAGTYVFFGEYLEGHSAMVQSDGSFSYFTFAPPGISAEVTAIAIDLHGNQSAEVSAILPA